MSMQSRLGRPNEIIIEKNEFSSNQTSNEVSATAIEQTRIRFLLITSCAIQ